MRKSEIILIRNAQPYDFGGGERFPVFLAAILCKNNVSALIVSRNPKLIEYAQSLKLDTHKGLWWSNQNWSGRRALLFPTYVMWQLVLFAWYLGLFMRIHPKAVHIQSKDDFIAATYAGRLVGARVVWTDHADLKHIWKNLRVWHKNPVGKWVFCAARFAHAITVVSKSELAEVTAHLADNAQIRDKITVVYNGSEDKYSNYPSHLVGDIFTYCIVSRLVTDKGIGEAITAFRAIHERHPQTRLLLVGNGPEQDKFIAQAGGEESIVFAGYQSDPLSYIAQSHVFMQPTYHEGFSVSLVEASMMQKPIIATAVGGNVEIIQNGKTGILVPAKDSAALEQAMEQLFTDGKLRDTLAHNARAQYLKRFVFNTIVSERFMKLYEKTPD